jgi:hypothetical protein
MNVPLLITSAIQPPPNVPFLQLTDPIKRKLATKAALLFWVMKGVKRIVLADATGGTALSEAEVAELRTLQVETEQISYAQDVARLIERGKGYAEGQLIEFALRSSQILSGATHFYKSTGKTFVRNFADIHNLILRNSFDVMFWKRVEPHTLMQPWADCRFYFTSMDFARQQLIPAYQRTDDKVAACEYHIMQELNRSATTGLGLRPFVCGVEGGTDQDYFDQSLGILDTQLHCWAIRRAQ